MYVAGFICLFIAIYGFVTGDGSDLTPSLFFAGIGIFLIYRKATEKKRVDEKRVKREAQERAQREAHKNETKKSSRVRFSSSNFASILIKDLRNQNWSALDSKTDGYNGIIGGCEVYKNGVEIIGKTYRFADYGLENLDLNGCEQLATYIGEMYGGTYYIKEIIRAYGGYTGGYSGYTGSDGSISISRDYSGGTRTVGYKVYKPPIPKKKW